MAEETYNNTFWLFVRNLMGNEKCLPKNMVIATTTKGPIALKEASEDVGWELGKCLNIWDDA